MFLRELLSWGCRSDARQNLRSFPPLHHPSQLRANNSAAGLSIAQSSHFVALILFVLMAMGASAGAVAAEGATSSEVRALSVENSASTEALQSLQDFEARDSHGPQDRAAGASTTDALDSFFGPANQRRVSDLPQSDSAVIDTMRRNNPEAFSSLSPKFSPSLEDNLTIANNKQPFVLRSTQDGNILHLNFTLRGESYLYQNSLSLTSLDKGVVFVAPQLPPSTTHSDALGDSEVFFKELHLAVPLLQGKSGDRLRLSYQGCDENGICYPPQRINIVLTHDVVPDAKLAEKEATSGKTLWAATGMPSTRHEEAAKDKSELSESSSMLPWGDFDLVTDENSYSNSLSKTIADNLIIGVLLCFVLGIGLYLTPCVLPMLPIFSAMIVGSSKARGGAAGGSTAAGSGGTAAGAGRRWGSLLLQNGAYAFGLTITYTVLGLIMSMVGASLHSVLQSPTVLVILALLLVLCALACAGVIELQVPSAITAKLQNRINRLNTHNFYGAFMLGALSALIASPCTSAPLAGALLYLMQNGNLWVGGLSFFAIGLGMATPLLIIGIFGSKFLQRYSFIGDLVKRILVVVLLFTAFYLVAHLLGRLELVVSSLLVYIVILYTLSSIGTYIYKHRLNMMLTLLLAVVSLIPTYFAFGYLEQNQLQKDYEYFTKTKTLSELQKATQDEYSFVVFTAKWCTNCKYMEDSIYSQHEFLEHTNNIKLVVVDITDAQNPDTQEIMDSYHVIGVPFYMTLVPDGSVLHSQLGLTQEAQVMSSLKQLHDRRYRDFLESNDASEHILTDFQHAP